MLAKCKDVCLDPETGEISLLKMFQVRGVFRIFFREVAPIFITFSSVVFSGRVNFKQLKHQKRLFEGPGACSLVKILKICILQWPF